METVNRFRESGQAVCKAWPAADGRQIEKPAARRGDDIPVMLGIKEISDRFGLPPHFVRQLVKSGKVYAVQAGSKKFYINMQSVIDYLNGVTPESVAQ